MFPRLIVAVMCLVLAAGCGQKPGSESKSNNQTSSQTPPAETPSSGMRADGTLELLGYTATPPSAWTSEPPSSNMRLAQFATPAADGAEAGEAVVFFFGSGQGGSVDANLQRWSNQVKDDAGNPVQPKIEKPSGTKFPTTVAEYTGTYARTMGMGASSEAKPGQTMIAGIVETPRGSLFIQLYGPTATVDAQREAFLAFVKSVG